MKHIQTINCSLDIKDLYTLDIIFNIERINFKFLRKKNNILISSMPTKVHDEQCFSSAHSKIVYNSGKNLLTIEKFIRISGH
jgi:hypothetical protein